MRAIRNLEELDPVQRALVCRTSRRRFIMASLLLFVAILFYWRYFADTPHDYPDTADQFKYGSIGSDISAGIPYWIWWALPDLYPKYLPDKDAYEALPDGPHKPAAGYAQFGFVFEAGHDLPIGFSTRRLTVERVGLNCAVCHVSTVRVNEDMDPERLYRGAQYVSYTSDKKERAIILGMPAATMDLGAYLRFLAYCVKDDPRDPTKKPFDWKTFEPAIAKYHPLHGVERLAYKRAVAEVKRVIEQQDKELPFLEKNPLAGPGRVDTFNPYKNHVFKFPYDGTIGTSDYPSIWNQRPREGMQLHWDGNNTSVFERNISASLGTGATPATLDFPRMLRVAAWIGAPDPHKPFTDADARIARADPRPRPGELQVPGYPFKINAELASVGRAVYRREKCNECHDFDGKYIGRVIRLNKIRTDEFRLKSYTNELAANQNSLGAGTWWRFSHFRRTDGYVNMPLDGLWARAPYLHNGSVPTLDDLLKPEKDRPSSFYRGDDAYDPNNVGFVSSGYKTDDPRSADGRKLFKFETSKQGNAATGHSGRYYLAEDATTGLRAGTDYLKDEQGRPYLSYGTELSPEDKKALLEYLKTL